MEMIFAALLAVCALPGHAQARHPLPTPVPHSTSAAVMQIAMYGDSTMLGITKETGAFTVTSRNAPTQLAAMLNAAGYPVTISNYGVTFTTTGNLLNGVNGIPRSWVAEMASSTANIVVINMGMNDAFAIYNGTETIDVMKANWTQLVQIAQQQGKIVYMETPNPRSDNVVPDSMVMQVAAAELQVADANPGVVWIGVHAAILAHMPNWQSHLPDGLHPDDQLYTYKACVEAGVLIPHLTLN